MIEKLLPDLESEHMKTFYELFQQHLPESPPFSIPTRSIATNFLVMAALARFKSFHPSCESPVNLLPMK
jgi:hypothetical protein